MANVVNLASDEALVKEAYARVKASWTELQADQLLQVNLDLQLALQTILGAWPEIKALRDKIAKELPAFDVAQFDQLEDHALGLMYVQARYAMATQPPDDLADLVAEASKLRDMLYADAQALLLRGLFDPRKLTGLKGGSSYKNLAEDLQALATELESILPIILGKAGTTAEDLTAATQMATRLTRVIGVREQSPAVLAALAEERLRGFTRVIRVYEDARAAVMFIRRREGDADSIAPNLYSGNGRRRRGGDADVAPPIAPFSQAPVTPLPGSIPAVTQPPNAAPAAAKAVSTTEPFGA